MTNPVTREAEGYHERKDRELLQRVAKAGGQTYMGYGDTSTTKRLTERGLLRWHQANPFVATIYLTDAGWKAARDA